jgi:deazaflavin-dependent oxidoreductase (nitroreductase family)
MDERRFKTALALYTLNPIVKLGAALGMRPPRVVLLETTGRKSGKPRRTPVGARPEDGSLWLVAEHGRQAGYVRNIEANPRVRVKMRGGWHSGTAKLLPDDDPRMRLRKLSKGSPGLMLNALAVRAMATDPLTVRIDLDPSTPQGTPG